MLLSEYDRLIKGLRRRYRQRVFLDRIRSKSKGLYIISDYTLINRNVSIGDGVIIYPGVMFFGQGNIRIGNNVNFGNNTVLYASPGGGITLGNDVMIAADCYIIDSDHGTNANINIADQEDVVQEVIIGNDVWLGAGVKVLRGSIIEDGAVIGAGAVVKGNIKKNSIAAGIPARTIGMRKAE